ncbi:MAG: dockerin type I repeat-containing protein [Dehalococcoidia bacterium]|nr:dockerin type I repeat-containing protein [Dehalococcoidia bacterium]
MRSVLIAVVTVLVIAGTGVLPSRDASAGGTTLRIASATAPIKGVAHVAIAGLDVPPPGLGAWTLDIVYDSSITFPLDCVTREGGLCKTVFDDDSVRMTGAVEDGLTGQVWIASYAFGCGSNAGIGSLDLQISVFADAGDPPQNIDADVVDGSITCSARGDVNCDGDINPIDAVLVLQLGTTLLNAVACPENTDTNGDGLTSAVDAALILQLNARLISVLPGDL